MHVTEANRKDIVRKREKDAGLCSYLFNFSICSVRSTLCNMHVSLQRRVPLFMKQNSCGIQLHLFALTVVLKHLKE